MIDVGANALIELAIAVPVQRTLSDSDVLVEAVLVEIEPGIERVEVLAAETGDESNAGGIPQRAASPGELKPVVHHAAVVGLVVEVLESAVAQAQVVPQLVHEGSGLLEYRSDLTRPASQGDQEVEPADKRNAGAAVAHRLLMGM